MFRLAVVIEVYQPERKNYNAQIFNDEKLKLPTVHADFFEKCPD